MRLIDADKLFEYIQKEKAWKQDTQKLPRYGQGKYDAYYEMLNIINSQPTAERDKMRCENCKHIRSNDNFHWCGCTAGLDGNRKPTDFCSYFEPKESEGK